MPQEGEKEVEGEEVAEEKEEEFEEGVENVKDFYGGDDKWYDINDIVDSEKKDEDIEEEEKEPEK